MLPNSNVASGTRRIVYLAVADARGHLVRAHLLRQLLAQDGVQVDVVTTSEAGLRFLAAQGTRATRIVNPGRGELGELQGEGAPRRVAQYLAQPERGLDELTELARLARGAAFVVNDSLHPALLAVAALGRPFKVVHVASDVQWAALARLCDDQGPKAREVYRAALSQACHRAFGRLTFTLGRSRVDLATRSWLLPAVVAEPGRPPAEVRAAHGAPLAVVYLSARHQHPRLAANIEAAVAARGLALYGVSEVFAARRGWVARDPRLADAVAAADVYISGAGMSALEQAAAYRTPFVALCGRRPDQARHLELLGGRGERVRVAQLGPDTERQLAAALAEVPLRQGFADPASAVRPVQRAWRQALATLASLAGPAERRGRSRPRAAAARLAALGA